MLLVNELNVATKGNFDWFNFLHKRNAKLSPNPFPPSTSPHQTHTPNTHTPCHPHQMRTWVFFLRVQNGRDPYSRGHFSSVHRKGEKRTGLCWEQTVLDKSWLFHQCGFPILHPPFIIVHPLRSLCSTKSFPFVLVYSLFYLRTSGGGGRLREVLEPSRFLMAC